MEQPADQELQTGQQAGEQPADLQAGQQASSSAKRPIGELLFWLLLIPVFVGALLCAGQLALVVDLETLASETRSLLAADYRPWAYDLIPPVDIAALIEDVLKDREVYGPPIEPLGEDENPGPFWIPPSPTATGVDEGPAQENPQPAPTDTPVPEASSTPTDAPTPTPRTPSPTPSPTVTSTPSPTATNTRPPFIPTATHTSEPQPTRTPTRTASPTASPTLTKIPPTTAPTRTPTRRPTQTASRTPSPTVTLTPTVTFTPTKEHTPTPTETFTPEGPVEDPTITPVTPPPVAPVRPVAENGGASEPEGEMACRAYFGYRNENPQDMNIPVGERNYLTESAISVNPGLPEVFTVGRVAGAFEVIWDTGGPISWVLDGQSATANWCR